MADLFTVDTEGDASVRRDLAIKKRRKDGGSSSAPVEKRKLTAKEKRRKLLAQEKELASLIFEEAAPAEQEDDFVDAEEFRPDDDDDDDDDDDEEEDGEDDAEDDDDEEEEADEEEASASAAAKPPATNAAPPAWVDEDDDDQLISLAGDGPGMSRKKKLRSARSQRSLSGKEYVAGLRRQFESVQPDVGWAALPPVQEKRKKSRGQKKKTGAEEEEGGDGDEEEEEGEEEGEEEDDDDEETDAVLRSAGKLLGASSALPPNILSVRRLTDLNHAERSASISSCVQWHPNGKLALTAGLDKTLRLFRTDGVDNPKLQSIFVDRLPITSASFTADGSQVVLCGSAKHW